MLDKGTRLSHYRILRLLGSGGMADVYEAEDQRLGRVVALKVLPPEFGRSAELVARFQVEVRSAASLNHRGIVTVFEVGHDQGVHFYSMRLLSGGDLGDRIDKGMTQQQALETLRQVADAFVHAHGRGFVHRDVKPPNILFDEQGHPVLTDFGIAKALEGGSRITATGVSIGTPAYISPEQARGRAVDARTDLYSLGVVLYEMLVGKPPYEGQESLAVIFKHVTEPVPKLPQAHARLQPLIDRLMAKEPDQRPASAAELIALIDQLQPRASGDTASAATPAATAVPAIAPSAAAAAPMTERLPADPASVAPAASAAAKLVSLSGRLDTTRVREVETGFYAQIGAAKSGDVVIVDLSAIEFVSSLGLRMLLTAAKTLAQRKASVGMVSPASAMVLETLKISGLINLFRFFPSEQAARAALAAS